MHNNVCLIQLVTDHRNMCVLSGGVRNDKFVIISYYYIY